jgi:hypothetical protein
MLEMVLSCPSVLRRHQEGPFAGERSEYLKGLSAQGMARGTLLH